MEDGYERKGWMSGTSRSYYPWDDTSWWKSDFSLDQVRPPLPRLPHPSGCIRFAMAEVTFPINRGGRAASPESPSPAQLRKNTSGKHWKMQPRSSIRYFGYSTESFFQRDFAFLVDLRSRFFNSLPVYRQSSGPRPCSILMN